jgi:hypothetical protein
MLANSMGGGIISLVARGKRLDFERGDKMIRHVAVFLFLPGYDKEVEQVLARNITNELARWAKADRVNIMTDISSPATGEVAKIIQKGIPWTQPEIWSSFSELHEDSGSLRLAHDMFWVYKDGARLVCLASAKEVLSDTAAEYNLWHKLGGDTWTRDWMEEGCGFFAIVDTSKEEVISAKPFVQ